MFKLALAQMKVVPGELERNLERAEKAIASAAEGGAQVVLLPEAMDLGWAHPSARDGAAPVPGGMAHRKMAEAARRHGVYVCSGLTERKGERVYNAAVLIDPGGELLLHHRKINELEIAHAYYEQGDRLGVARTPFGTLGLMICADGFARGEVPARALGYMGADLILSPSAWAVPAEHDNEQEPYGSEWRACYGPVARDFRLWIASASCVGPMTAGPWKGRRCIGCSMVVAPGGGVAMQGPYGEEAEELLYIDIEPEPRPARGTAWEEYWKGKELSR